MWLSTFARRKRKQKRRSHTQFLRNLPRLVWLPVSCVFDDAFWKREESISVISCSSKETIRFSSQKRLLVWLSKILQRRDDARANYFYSSSSFDDAPLSCPQTWWTVSFVLRCCCCSPFWCFVVDNRRVVVMSDCFCLYPRFCANKKWRQKMEVFVSQRTEFRDWRRRRRRQCSKKQVREMRKKNSSDDEIN